MMVPAPGRAGACARPSSRPPASAPGSCPATKAHAQGDAAGRRQAGDPVRRRGGRRGRPRRRPHDHRPQQARPRGPLRPRTSSSRRRSRPRATTTGWRRSASPADLADIHYVRQGDPLGLGHAVLVRRASTSATSRSRCCSATTSSTRATRCSSAMIDVRERARRQRRRADGGAAGADLTSTAARPSSADRRRTDVVRVTDLVEKPRPGRRAEQPGHHRPLRARPGGLRRAARRPRPAAAARSSSPTRCRRWPARRPSGGGVHGVRLPRPPLRHRRPAGLPARPSSSSPASARDLGRGLRAAGCDEYVDSRAVSHGAGRSA